MNNEKINELIAEHIMGYRNNKNWDDTHKPYMWRHLTEAGHVEPMFPNYCEDIKAAFDILGEVDEWYLIRKSTWFTCQLKPHRLSEEYFEGRSKQKEMAIALAAMELIKARDFGVE